MKILVINTGSSSIKYQLFDLDFHQVLARGVVEKIGEKDSRLTHKVINENDEEVVTDLKDPIDDHHQGLIKIVDLLTHARHGAVSDKSDISAVGHRVVHGGETFQSSVIIDEQVIEAIRQNVPLAPLHNPSNLTGIETARTVFPRSPQVAVFDTAFHHTLPAKAFLYAVPYALYEKHRVRRYGFHGTSHSYVARKAASFLEKPIETVNLITVHLGNGASMAAIEKGRCIDTTMGMTPLEGLVMGTRSGDLDPAVCVYLANHLNMSVDDIDRMLNKESGLKGICGSNDMRDVLEKKQSGDLKAGYAFDIYTYRIKKYIGAYYAALERVDGIVFTGGIGENSSDVRYHCCKGLTALHIEIDRKKNAEVKQTIRRISTDNSPVAIVVAPTDEELKIALEARRVLTAQNGSPAGGLKADQQA